MVITVSVPDESDKYDVATCMAATLGNGCNATVWEWDDFWADVTDEVVTPAGDTTAGVSL